MQHILYQYWTNVSTLVQDFLALSELFGSNETSPNATPGATVASPSQDCWFIVN